MARRVLCFLVGTAAAVVVKDTSSSLRGALQVESEYELTEDLEMESESELSEGLECRYFYDQSQCKVPDLGKLKLGNWVVLPKVDISNGKFPKLKQRDRFCMRCEGHLFVKKEGKYKLFTASDDGSLLYLNDKKVVDNDSCHGEREKSSGWETLSAGFHKLRADMCEMGGGEVMRIRWQGPDSNDKKVILPTSALRYGKIGQKQYVPGCSRKAGWCDKNKYSNNMDCDLDGLGDEICEAPDGKRWIRLSSNCGDNTYNNGKSPTCGHIRRERRVALQEAKKFMYIAYSDKRVYKKEFDDFEKGSWKKTSRGDVISVIIPDEGDVIYAIGNNKHVFKQSLGQMTTNTHWVHAAKGAVTDGAVADGIFYGVGTNHKIYKQTISKMSPKSHWTEAGRGDVTSISISGGKIYGSGKDGMVYYQVLKDMTKTTKWTQIKQAGWCKFIGIRDGVIWTLGSDSRHLFKQSLAKMEAGKNEGWQKAGVVGSDKALGMALPSSAKCRGKLLKNTKDDIACDTIKVRKDCNKFYERVGKTDTYLQCVPMDASQEENGLFSCLAQDPCHL